MKCCEFPAAAVDSGLEPAGRYAFDGFTLVYLRNAELSFELALTINAGHEGKYDLGNGYGHLAVSVQDIEAEHARFESAGLAPLALKSLSHEGTLLARFFFVSDPDGYKIEVIQRGGRFV